MQEELIGGAILISDPLIRRSHCHSDGNGKDSARQQYSPRTLQKSLALLLMVPRSIYPAGNRFVADPRNEKQARINCKAYFFNSNPAGTSQQCALKHRKRAATIALSLYTVTCIYSLCSITINPMIPSRTVFNQGCSLSMIVTYPTIGIYPLTLPTISS